MSHAGEKTSRILRQSEKLSIDDNTMQRPVQFKFKDAPGRQELVSADSGSHGCQAPQHTLQAANGSFSKRSMLHVLWMGNLEGRELIAQHDTAGL